MKVHPLTLLAGLLGWLVRLGLSAAVVALVRAERVTTRVGGRGSEP
jgi:hypothetical protein